MDAETLISEVKVCARAAPEPGSEVPGVPGPSVRTAGGPVGQSAGMNMTLSRRGDYVLRAAVHLASRAGAHGFVSLDELSARMSIPRSYTPQIMGALVAVGLVASRAGPGGGYRLARPPESISLLEIIELGEGGLAQARCPLRGVPCHWGTRCAIHPTMSSANDGVRETLRGTTLADVATEELRLAEATRSPSGRLVAD
jgi:Rrf2 family protein